MRRHLLIICTVIAPLLGAPAAHASALGQLFAPLHIHPASAPPASFIDSHFSTITVQPSMLREGYDVAHTGIYTKGTRSLDASFPESWYLHSPSGARVKDSANGYFVMNPKSSGWRNHVLNACKPTPGFCFVDAMGVDGYQRATPRPNVSQAWWIKATTGEANFLENASARFHIVANNLTTSAYPGYRVAYEMFGRTSAKKSLWVLRHTTCFCFAKFGTEQSALYGYTLFLAGAGKRDRISVGSDSQAGTWWDFFDTASQLGAPTGRATNHDGVLVRGYTNGVVMVNTNAASRQLTVRRSGYSLGGHTGRIVIG
ncbi:MAG TPA: hypothetical protein VFH74_12515 [Gaiellales bacterium]|nr:hypothetical protein [Gaiellales bacterium]